jgi:Na+-driven multidrug efflux pump
MPAPTWIERLRQRWKVNSAWQVIIILIVFACTGFSVYFLKKPILKLLGNQDETIAAKILYYLFILPLYNLLLLGYGFIFGQFNFFWAFEKRMFARIAQIFKKS